MSSPEPLTPERLAEIRERGMAGGYISGRDARDLLAEVERLRGEVQHRINTEAGDRVALARLYGREDECEAERDAARAEVERLRAQVEAVRAETLRALAERYRKAERNGYLVLDGTHSWVPWEEVARDLEDPATLRALGGTDGGA